MTDKELQRQQQRERIALVSRLPGEALRPTVLCHEVRNRRALNSKTFNMGNGNHKLVIGKAPVHFKDGDDWHDIDLTVTRHNGGSIGTDKAPYRLELLTDRVGYTYTSRAGGRVDLELVEVGDSPVDYATLTTSIDGNQFFWDGVAPGLRLKAQLKPQGVEIFKELADDKTPRRFLWRVRQDVGSKCNFQAASGGYDSAKSSERVLGRLRKLEMVNEAHPVTVVDDGDRQYEQFLYEEEWTGRLSTIKDRKTRQKEWTSDAVYPVIVDVLVSEQIAANINDGNQTWTTTPTLPPFWYYSGSVDKVGFVPGTGTPTIPYNFEGGFRFTSIPVPQGVTISSAVLKFFATAVPLAVPALIQADDVDDAPAFSNANLPRSITPTTASSTFTFPATTVAAWTTANVTGVVQEIIGRPGWAPGNDMRFAAFRQLTGTTNVAYIQDYAFNPALATILEIDYVAPPTPSGTPECPPELLGKYKVHLYNPLGTLVAVFDDWRRLEIKHLVNDPGYCSLKLSGFDSRTALFEKNSIVEILRKLPGSDAIAVPESKRRENGWYVEFEGLHADVIETVFKNGDKDFVSLSRGYLDFAARRAILWKATEIASESKKIGIASQTAMYEFVNENCGPAALAASDRLIDGVITGLTVPNLGASGALWYGMRAYRNVLSTLQAIANFAGIDFDIVGNGVAAWRFETYPDQLGEDRTTIGLDTTTGLNGDGNPPVIFSIEAGNVSQITYKKTNTGSANVIVTTGKGNYTARLVGVETNADEIDPFRINQREVTRNATTQDSQDELDTLAQEYLEQYQTVEDIKFTPLRSRSTLYGVDFWWGDKITSRHKETDFNKRLVGVTIVVDKNGEQFRGWDFRTIP